MSSGAVDSKSVKGGNPYGGLPKTDAVAGPTSEKSSPTDAYATKSAFPIPGASFFRGIVSSFFQDPIQAQIDKVDASISTAKPGDVTPLLDRKHVLTGLMKDRDIVGGLEIKNFTVSCSLKQTIADIERLARTPSPSEDEIQTVHEHVVLLQNYADLEKKNEWLQKHCSLKTRLAPSGRDVISLVTREFMMMDSAAGTSLYRFRESDNPADQKVASVADKALSKQSQWNDWEKRDPSDWKALSREVKELKEIYDSPEWRIFSESLTREKSSEYTLALSDMEVLPKLLKDFQNFKPEKVSKDQLAGIRSYLLDRIQAHEDAILDEMDPYLYETGELGGQKIKLPKDIDLDPKHLTLHQIVDKLYEKDDSELEPGLLELRKEAHYIDKLKSQLEKVDLDDKEDTFKTLEKVATHLDRTKNDQVKHALLGLVERLEKIPVKEEELTENTVGSESPMAIRREITRLFMKKDISEKDVVEGASKIVLMTSRASYIRLAECRVQELEKKLKEISTADSTVSATMPLSFGPYGSFGTTRKIDEGMKADELKMKTLVDGYRGVLSSLRSDGDQAAAIEKFAALEKSPLHEMIEEHFSGAEVINTFTKGIIVTAAACATGGYAASLIPEAFAATAYGSFIALGVETAAFTISMPIYRSLIDFENPIIPIKEMWNKPGDLGEKIVVNMLVFGALRKSTSLFGEAFSALAKREGTQVVLKKMGDFLAKLEKDPKLQAELSAGIQKTFVNVGAEGGALVTQTGVLQVSDFIQTAKALDAAGDDDPIGHAFEKTFSSKTLLKEFAFNVALHIAPSPSHGPKEKAVESPKVSGEIETEMAACGVKETDKGRFTYDPAKKERLITFFQKKKLVMDAKDSDGVKFNFLGDVVEVSVTTPLGVQTTTFQPQAAAN